MRRKTEISLSIALIHIGLLDYKKAQKMLINEITGNENLHTFPLYRTIRLINLIIHYELNNMEYIRTESRSIKREISREKKAYRSEHLIINLLNRNKNELRSSGGREKLRRKTAPELTDIRNSVFENQMLKFFDFTAWVESKICKTPLSEVLKSRFA
jgi:hypothetical protein